LKLPDTGSPKTSYSGLGVGQWAVIMNSPDWKDLKDLFIRESYDYPKWYNNLKKFQKRKFSEYYRL
jgi:hypothetical protein